MSKVDSILVVLEHDLNTSIATHNSLRSKLKLAKKDIVVKHEALKKYREDNGYATTE